MAASPQDRTSADNILKEFYLGPIRSQLNSQTLLMRRLQKREDVFEGRRIVVPLHTGRNAGVMARPESTNLPVAGRQAYSTTNATAKYVYGRIQISGPLLASARTNRGAFVSAIESEVKGVTRDMRKDLNRQFFGDGSGRLAEVTDVTNLATNRVLVREPWDYGLQGSRLKNINVNDRIAFEDVSDNSVQSVLVNDLSYTVTAVNLTTREITTGASTTVAVGDRVVKAYDTGLALTAGAQPANNTTLRGRLTGNVADTQKELMGLVGIMSGNVASNWPSGLAGAYTNVGTGQVYAANRNGGTFVYADLQGLSATTEPTWASNNSFNAGVPRPLTTDLMQQQLDNCEVLGEARPSIILCSHAVRRAYVNLLTADRRYVNEYMLDGGFKAVDFDGVPIVPEIDCPEGTMLGVCEPNLWIGRMSDFYFLDKDGAVFSRVQNQDSWEATLAYYAELCCERRNAMFALGDIAI